jgi:hypothetical protein
LATSKPATCAVPLVGIDSVVIMRTVVVLPAPFGPSMEKTVPAGTEKLTPSTAVKSPKVLTRSTASIAGALTGDAPGEEWWKSWDGRLREPTDTRHPAFAGRAPQ